MKIRSIGPAGMSGRITAIDVNLSDKDHILAGAASGGVWESKNGGISWNPIFDNEATLSIGSIAINQNNPAEIWVGTGEGNPRNSVNTGKGIYKSIDGGKTWKLMGLEKTKAIHRVIINKENPNIVFAAAIGSPWGEHPERGVYRTNDGGKTWTHILKINSLTGAGDLVVDPSNPNKLIAAMWEHKRTPWDFVSGGKGSGLYLTYDGGDNWKQITKKEGLPKGDLGRIGLAFAPSKPNIVYALVEAKENGLYKSTDGGENWKLVAKKNIGNRPFYYADIFVDALNENRIYNLWSYVSRSEDGGKTFETIMDYGNNVHPDHHAFWIDPTDSNYFIDGNDGGLVISRDGGDTYQFAGNIPVGQFYHINIDNDFPYHIYGGMQDNGSWIGPSSVLKRGGIRNYDWQELYFGDGFDVMPYRADSRYGYAMSQGGNVGYYDRETGAVQFVKPVSPDSTKLRYNWNAPIAQDPNNDCGLYFGSQFVHYSDDCGMSWKIISPDLTTNDTSKQYQDVSGGLTIDATNAENHTTLLTIAPSTLDTKVIWAGSDDGRVHITKDGGENWIDISRNFNGPRTGSWVPQIHVSTYNPGEAFVVVNDYRRNDYKPYLFHVTDYGSRVKRIIDQTDVPSFVLSVVQDPVQENLLFAGTDHGLYISIDNGNTWTHWDEDFPNVQVIDMKIHPRDGDLLIGTFGRAIWVMDDITPLRALAKDKAMTTKEFTCLPIPKAYDLNFRSYDGVRFIAQGEFVGDNRTKNGANISLWVKPDDKTDDKEEDKKKKVFVKVVNSEGDTIRSFSRKIGKGLSRIGWGLRQDGIEYPSRRDREKDADPPSGSDVLPGTYTLHFEYDSLFCSQEVEVEMDPRIQNAKAGRLAQQNAFDQLEPIIVKAKADFDRIKEAKQSIDRVKALLKVLPDSTAKTYTKLTDSISTELSDLEHMYFDKENLKGIQRNPDILQGKIWNARGYIGRGWKAPSGNAENAKRLLKTSAGKVAEAVDSFFEGTWKDFQGKIEALKLSPFKIEEGQG